MVSISPGHDDDKYVASEIIHEEGGIKFIVTLIIKACTKEDGRNSYHMMATNSLGSENYHFGLVVSDKIETTTGTSTVTTTSSTGNGNGTGNGTEGGGGGGDDDGNVDGHTDVPTSSHSVVILVVLGILVVIGLIAGGWFIHKRKSARVDSGPLSNREVRP